MLRIASFNVNGIRAAQRRGIETWWAQTCPDILAIQEMRAPAQAIPEGLFDGWHLAYHEGNLPGRNGVALLSRTPPAAVRHGFGHRASDPEGRYVEADYDLDGLALRVGSVYVPKGATWEGPDADPAKYRRKMQFMASFRSYLTRARREAAREGREFLVMGDLNVAHGRQDLKNWRGAGQKEGFLPEERAWLDTFVAAGYVDTFRLFEQEGGHYTWWDYRFKARDRNVGWRIDYFFVSEELRPKVKRAWIDAAVLGSDHCPVGLELDYR